MKRRMGLALALTAFGAVSALWAVETTPEQARIAARNWIGKSPDRMTAKFASSADRGVQTSKNAEGRALYHVVSLAGGGYVVASGGHLLLALGDGRLVAINPDGTATIQ